jgi:hypothetical protein
VIIASMSVAGAGRELQSSTYESLLEHSFKYDRCNARTRRFDRYY